MNDVLLVEEHDNRVLRALRHIPHPGLRQIFFEASKDPELLAAQIAAFRWFAANARTERECSSVRLGYSKRSKCAD